MAASVETRNLVGSVLAVLLVGIAFAGVFRFMNQTRASAESRADVNAALQALEQGLSQLKDAETGQRGYLLTGQPEYLPSYESGRRLAASTINSFVGLKGARLLPQEDLDALRALVFAKLDELARTVQLAKEGKREEALSIVAEGGGLRTMDRLRALHDQLAAALSARRNLDEEKVRISRQHTQRALLGLGGVGLLAVLASALATQRNLRLRTASERARAASEAKFRALADHAPVGIFEMALDGHRPYINETLCRFAALSLEEASTLGFRHRIHPDDLERVLAHWGQVRASGTPSLLEYRFVLPDGAIRWVESRAAIVPGPDGHPDSFVGIVVDQTERRQSEEALEAANKELEAFAYSVSHDLRAPLRHIDGFVGLLRRSLGEDMGERPAHHLDVISASARQMGELIDDLLTFSRMGRAEVHAATFDLEALTRQVIGELEPDAAGRPIEWRVENLPSIKGDQALLRLVLLNLLGNALKFTRGRVPAKIGISAERSKGGIAISITDNGAGFDMRYADKLFGVFQRLHRQDEFEGTGIGLANVARIIHKHGGAVSAQGAVGQGATFSFTLPLPEVP
jgi:PAS domain S-box-containing protein